MDAILKQVSTLIEGARNKAAASINKEMVLLYWHVGNLIKTSILHNQRADYGKQVIRQLSKQLTAQYGRGFNETNLRYFLKFAEAYPDEQIPHSLSEELSWTHIRTLLYIEDPLKRDFYIELCAYENWSVRTLQNRIDSMLFERTAISRKPEKTISEDLQNLREKKDISPALTFRDPYVLDFLELHDSYSEHDLENAILSRLQSFIIEMGTDFAFLGRQRRITIDAEDFYIDLLFYHRSWRRLIAIDLKLGRFKAAYKGQMELYLRWLEKHEMREGEQTPIGLILCAEKKKEQVELMTLGDDSIRVAEYVTKLPDKKLFQEKLHYAVIEARKELAQKNGENHEELRKI
ncbi:MAG: DUF1016 domain-containing protein [bacterium]|nr:DUF1016 domain-containing protein [bacterium]